MQRLCISESNQFSFLFKWLCGQATNLTRIRYLIQLKGKYATNVVNFFFSHFHVDWGKGSKKKEGLVKIGLFWLLKFHILRINRIHKNRWKFYFRKKTASSFHIWGLFCFVNVTVLQNEGTDELQYNDNNINLERQKGLF